MNFCGGFFITTVGGRACAAPAVNLPLEEVRWGNAFHLGILIKRYQMKGPMFV